MSNLNVQNTNIGTRRLSLDITRIAAMVAVVFLHVSGMKWSLVTAGSYEWHVLNVYDSLSQWAVPVFVMISGALFLGSEKSVKDIYRKNILRIVTAFVFWSLLYAVGMLLTGFSLSESIKGFIGGSYQMWFLFLIVGLYMITPLLRPIARDRKLTGYFLVLSFLFAFVIPQFIDIVSLFSGSAGTFLTEVYDKFHLNFIIGFQFYYVLGYYLDNTRISGKKAGAIYALGIAGFLATILLTILIVNKSDNPLMFYDSFTVNVLLEAIFVFVLIKNCVGDTKCSGKVARALSKYCFGVYLIHAYLIYFADEHLGFGPLAFNPVLAVPALAVSVLIVSFLISAVLNAIPFVRKYFV